MFCVNIELFILKVFAFSLYKAPPIAFPPEPDALAKFEVKLLVNELKLLAKYNAPPDAEPFEFTALFEVKSDFMELNVPDV